LRKALEYNARTKDLELVIKALELAKDKLADLAKNCEWYADYGTEQERHHFLKVEAVANFVDVLDKELEAILMEGK